VALASVVTFVVQKREGFMGLGEMLPLGARIGNALISYCRYLGKLFWPTDLFFYLHPMQWPLGKVLLAGGLILGISVLVWVQRRRSPFLLMGWLWYCGTLAPASQVIQVGIAAMADRWTYIPSLAVLILTVWGACERTPRRRYQVLALSVAGGAAIVLCVALTWCQIGYWRDDEAFFRHGIEVPEAKYITHRTLSVIFYKKGQIDEVISQFREGVRLKPDNADAHHDLVVTFYQRGHTDEAIRQFQETIRLKPDHAQAQNNLGTALGLKGHTDEAIRQFQIALRLKPDYADARKNLDIVLATKARSSPPPGASTNR
jgi:tetratricopeptide (TPR) repeat protein